MDPGIIARGGGGKWVQVQLPENGSDNVVLFCFLVQRVSNGYFKENYYFLRFQRGSNFFKTGGEGESNFFQVGGGSNANFYRNPYNLWFSSGGLDPYPPSGSAHATSQLIFITSKESIGCGFLKDPSQEDDSFEHQNKCLDL